MHAAAGPHRSEGDAHESTDPRPLVLVTGAAGGIGSALAASLCDDYRVVGLDVHAPEAGTLPFFEVDLTQDHSVAWALHRVRERFGDRIASVVHLAAYFDFTGEPDPRYEAVNVAGTRRLLRELQSFAVEQFLYAGTMLVHRAVRPGERIDETTPLAPGWAYPQSKARAEAVIHAERGDIPCLLLHLAGLYDDDSAVPTLAHQIARIYERDLQSRLYAGDPAAGQAMVHRDDVLDAIARGIARRAQLPPELTVLVGEADAVAYDRLQQQIGTLVHGEAGWATLQVPAPVAKAGAWLQQRAEPVVPDPIDQGKPPFIRPFMVAMASDHYALDTTRARRWLGWEPRHDIRRTLPSIVAALKCDPLSWYRAHGMVPPPWLASAAEATDDPEALRVRAERHYRDAHHRHAWAPFLTAALGTWLLTAPPLLGHGGGLAASDAASGALLVLLGLLALTPRLAPLRWGSALVGLWVLFAPLAFHTPSAAAYLNDTLCGLLAIALSVLVRPAPGVDRVARETGPTVPPGWSFSPSSWVQRLPIIALAFVGLYVSRYLAAYQLGHLDGVWEPFFAGSAADPRNGTEEIITSRVSEAWPVPDAGVGALTYALEILTGLAGSSRRWRTMPWLVAAFGIMIVPLGVVSITFIIIQPILLGTWCTLCLVGAAAMLLQIPYSLDELVATGQFLLRRKRAGRSLLRVFFTGDTDTGADARDDDGGREDAFEFGRPPREVLRDVFGGGVGLPWTLAASLAIGAWLMLTRLSLGSTGAMANADHLIGALVLTVSVSALAEVGRPLRLLNIPLGIALLVTPFAYAAGTLQTAASLACGAALVALALPRGAVRMRYGGWNRWIV